MVEVPKLPPRKAESHKGSYGRLLLIGGSTGMSGAIALSGMSALRSGAGLVTIATSVSVAPVVAAIHPCYTLLTCPQDSEGRIDGSSLPVLLDWYARADCIAIGPGLGQSAGLQQIVYELYANCPVPLVVDADALNLLATCGTSPFVPAGPRILTPHPGEFRRLVGNDSMSVTECRSQAPALAQKFHAVVVCKGDRTLVTNGAQSYVNTTGNPGMATGGTGDVLTGILAALLGQKLGAWEGAVLGVYLHGLAGDLAVRDIGESSLIASDLIDYLPASFQQHHRQA